MLKTLGECCARLVDGELGIAIEYLVNAGDRVARDGPDLLAHADRVEALVAEGADRRVDGAYEIGQHLLRRTGPIEPAANGAVRQPSVRSTSR